MRSRGPLYQNLASVFRTDEEPWIDPNGATVERIVEVVKRCPSGALSYAICDGTHWEIEFTDEKN